MRRAPACTGCRVQRRRRSPTRLEAEPRGHESGQVLLELLREHWARAETTSCLQCGVSKRPMTGGTGRK